MGRVFVDHRLKVSSVQPPVSFSKGFSVAPFLEHAFISPLERTRIAKEAMSHSLDSFSSDKTQNVIVQPIHPSSYNVVIVIRLRERKSLSEMQISDSPNEATADQVPATHG
jgi:hypothetical protein